MSEQWLDLSRSEAGVAYLRLLAPGRMPVISRASAQALADHLEALADDAQIRAVVLRGADAQFCAGGDIAAIADSFSDLEGRLGGIIDPLHRAVRTIRAMPQPVVASVAGAAAGAGFSLAMACDLVICAADARFVVGYPALGTSSDGGLSYTLTRRIGAQRAMDVLLLRGALGAAEAQALGLVARVVDPDSLAAQTEALATQLAQQPVQAVRAFKALLNQAETGSLAELLDAERAAFLGCAATADFRRRVDAFLSRSTRT